MESESAFRRGRRGQVELEFAEGGDAVGADHLGDSADVAGAGIGYRDHGSGLVKLVEVSRDVRIRGIAYEYDVAGSMRSSGYVHGSGSADVVDDHELMFHYEYALGLFGAAQWPGCGAAVRTARRSQGRAIVGVGFPFECGC
ncbi:hypothetical protein [Glycomyces endophyticus]|uniref:hypothetical protein n=1 Tax=Glycomyces endophyticus TaxID=480996 RepID=UPI0031E21DB7